uniref:Protein transport protein Sec61 subunit beta n=1 Tax=Plectus sambesii TaxID=2011161 RepID=A0A914X5V6_9BILA
MSDTTRSPGRSGGRSAAAGGGGGGTVRQRRGGASTKSGSGSSGGSRATATSGGMWRFYTDDSSGIKIGPVPVLVMSLVFIASVFLLHIWGKYTRSH